ncbi:MAG: dipeptide/oligopeptide/nickel ABC transporter ATP-binding protein [Gordonia sp. (in: high G+C Gram-positive bacteria)]
MTRAVAHGIVVDGLSVSVGGTRIVDEVSFTIAAGERVGLLGQSGSGKSTIASALIGQLAPTMRVTGRIVIAGTDVAGTPPPQRPAAARPAMVFQSSATALNPLVTVGAQLADPIRRLCHDDADAASNALCDMGFTDPDRILRSFPMELSGGQRQRVCIALALACGGPLLIADEPTSALDVVSAAKVLAALDRARDAALTAVSHAPALLLITHDVAVAASRCDRLLLLDGGRIIEEGLATALIENPATDALRRLVERARYTDPLRVVAGVA